MENTKHNSQERTDWQLMAGRGGRSVFFRNAARGCPDTHDHTGILIRLGGLKKEYMKVGGTYSAVGDRESGIIGWI